jgi:hypothetical protein
MAYAHPMLAARSKMTLNPVGRLSSDIEIGGNRYWAG